MKLSVRTLRGTRFDELFITAVAPREGDAASSAGALYQAIAGVLREERAVPLRETISAALDRRDVVLAARRSAFTRAHLDADSPALQLSSADHPSIAAQLWAVRPRSSEELSVRTVEPGGCSGRLLRVGDLSMLWLARVTGRVGACLPAAVSAQAEQMFANVHRALGELGFEMHDVFRTWIYVRRLLDWYGELNRIRTAFYRERGVGPAGRAFPASTGIQAVAGDEECVIELVALRSEDEGVIVRPMSQSDRQGAAFAYGSSFSRGMSVRANGTDELFVSGTASIGADGRSLHAGSHEAQVFETLLAVAALIEPHGARLQDVVSGTVFYKDLLALSAYERVTRRLCVPELPLVPLRADVCRPELLVEIDAIVAVPTEGASEARRS